MKSRQIALCGVLVAVALVLSLVEKMISIQALIPIPGIKLGLSNVVTMFALTRLYIRQTLAIVLVRVTLASVFTGSITAFLFSLFGSLLALVVMKLLFYGEGVYVSLVGISVAGAAAHHIGQIGAAILVLGTIDVLGYLPMLLIVSIPVGVVTGLVCMVVLEHLNNLHL